MVEKLIKIVNPMKNMIENEFEEMSSRKWGQTWAKFKLLRRRIMREFSTYGAENDFFGHLL